MFLWEETKNKHCTRKWCDRKVTFLQVKNDHSSLVIHYLSCKNEIHLFPGGGLLNMGSESELPLKLLIFTANIITVVQMNLFYGRGRGNPANHGTRKWTASIVTLLTVKCYHVNGNPIFVCSQSNF